MRVRVRVKGENHLIEFSGEGEGEGEGDDERVRVGVRAPELVNDADDVRGDGVHRAAAEDVVDSNHEGHEVRTERCDRRAMTRRRAQPSRQPLYPHVDWLERQPPPEARDGLGVRVGGAAPAVRDRVAIADVAQTSVGRGRRETRAALGGAAEIDTLKVDLGRPGEHELKAGEGRREVEAEAVRVGVGVGARSEELVYSWSDGNV